MLRLDGTKVGKKMPIQQDTINRNNLAKYFFSCSNVNCTYKVEIYERMGWEFYEDVTYFSTK